MNKGQLVTASISQSREPVIQTKNCKIENSTNQHKSLAGASLQLVPHLIAVYHLHQPNLTSGHQPLTLSNHHTNKHSSPSPSPHRLLFHPWMAQPVNNLLGQHFPPPGVVPTFSVNKKYKVKVILKIPYLYPTKTPTNTRV